MSCRLPLLWSFTAALSACALPADAVLHASDDTTQQARRSDTPATRQLAELWAHLEHDIEPLLVDLRVTGNRDLAHDLRGDLADAARMAIDIRPAVTARWAQVAAAIKANATIAAQLTETDHQALVDAIILLGADCKVAARALVWHHLQWSQLTQNYTQSAALARRGMLATLEPQIDLFHGRLVLFREYFALRPSNPRREAITWAQGHPVRNPETPHLMDIFKAAERLSQGQVTLAVLKRHETELTFLAMRHRKSPRWNALWEQFLVPGAPDEPAQLTE